MSTVYFFQCTETSMIKIGHAGDVMQRLREIQSFSPTKLRAIAVMSGGKERESELHRRFSLIRSHGEWFFPSYGLLRFIADQCKIAHPTFQAKPWTSLDRTDFLSRTTTEQWIADSITASTKDDAPNNLYRFQLLVMCRICGGWEFFQDSETVADVCTRAAIDANVLELDWTAS